MVTNRAASAASGGVAGACFQHRYDQRRWERCCRRGGSIRGVDWFLSANALLAFLLPSTVDRHCGIGRSRGHSCLFGRVAVRTAGRVADFPPMTIEQIFSSDVPRASSVPASLADAHPGVSACVGDYLLARKALAASCGPVRGLQAAAGSWLQKRCDPAWFVLTIWVVSMITS